MTNDNNPNIFHTDDDSLAETALAMGKAVIRPWTPPRIAPDRWCDEHRQMDDCYID